MKFFFEGFWSLETSHRVYHSGRSQGCQVARGLLAWTLLTVLTILSLIYHLWYPVGVPDLLFLGLWLLGSQSACHHSQYRTELQFQASKSWGICLV